MPGNHDYAVFSDSMTANRLDAQQRFADLQRVGIRVLRNEALGILRDGQRLWLVGLDDLWGGGGVDLPKALAGVPEAEPRIYLEHNPDAIARIAAAPPGLILCGHTHGGQVVIPGLGPPLVPVRDRRFLRGPHRLGGHRIYVTSGIGYIIRVRFCCPPEVVLLRLVRDPAQAQP